MVIFLACMNKQIEHILSEYRDALMNIYGPRIEKVLLFGSYARGDADSGSDIDVLVILRGDVVPSKEIARTGKISSSLSLKNDCVISTVFISSDRYPDEKSPLIMNVHREGISL